MKNKKNLNLKEMVQAYIDYQCDEKLWNAFYTMTLTGFVSSETWEKFYKRCSAWYIGDDGLYDVNKKIGVFDEDGFLKMLEQNFFYQQHCDFYNTVLFDYNIDKECCP